MIIKIHASGKSFKGLVRYLGHDPKAETKERVAWTHTHNCANDHPAMALDEIYWTFRAAEALKREAGVRRGGRQTETPVKHISLSWDPEDGPGKAHMVATVESFLRHMCWSEHQAIVFAHNDTPHPHVHIVLNAVHPETGLKLDEGNDWKRAERWGLQYELERGDVKCRQRLLEPDTRTPTPTRETWQQLRDCEREDAAYEAGRVSGNWDYLDRKSPEERRDREWQALKEHQRQEREAFFADGRPAYREVSNGAYREVRAAFRSEWKDYFAAEREGLDREGLSAMKADILVRQKASLEVERCEAAKALRAERDKEYEQIKTTHRQQRQDLHQAQDQGRGYTLLHILHRAPKPREPERAASEHAQRSAARTREAWEVLRAYKAGSAAQPKDKQRGYFDRATPQDRDKRERDVLHAQQRAERHAYFAKGKEAYRSAGREARKEVAAEMRPTWQAIRQAKASGHDLTQLAGLRFIRLRQHKQTAQFRARIASLTVNGKRDQNINGIREHHKAERHVLRHRQLRGLRSYQVMDPDRALIRASEAVREAHARDEARQKDWRQAKSLPPASMAGLESEAARFASAQRTISERSMKSAEHEDRVRHAWRRTRPGPSRGRD